MPEKTNEPVYRVDLIERLLKHLRNMEEAKNIIDNSNIFKPGGNVPTDDNSKELIRQATNAIRLETPLIFRLARLLRHLAKNATPIEDVRTALPEQAWPTMPEHVQQNVRDFVEAMGDGRMSCIACVDSATFEPRYVFVEFVEHGSSVGIRPYAHMNTSAHPTEDYILPPMKEDRGRAN